MKVDPWMEHIPILILTDPHFQHWQDANVGSQALAVCEQEEAIKLHTISVGFLRPFDVSCTVQWNSEDVRSPSRDSVEDSAISLVCAQIQAVLTERLGAIYDAAQTSTSINQFVIQLHSPIEVLKNLQKGSNGFIVTMSVALCGAQVSEPRGSLLDNSPFPQVPKRNLRTAGTINARLRHRFPNWISSVQ